MVTICNKIWSDLSNNFVVICCRYRFRPQLSDKEAARAIIEIVESSCLNFR